MSLGEGKDCEWNALWQVYGVKPSDIINLGGKVKFRTGVLRFIGTWDSATNFVLSGQMAWVHHSARGAASATGERGSASATGESGSASATGERGAASATGWSGSASAIGESGAASATGWSGAASATGWRGAASATGESGSAFVTGLYGKARGGEGGCIALAYQNPKTGKVEMHCARTGKGQKCRANIWYQLNSKGKFVVVKP